VFCLQSVASLLQSVASLLQVVVLQSNAGRLLRRVVEEPAGYKSLLRCRAQTGCHGPPGTPHGELLSPGLATTNQAPNSSTRTPQPPYDACVLPAPPPSPEPKLQRPTPPATAASRRRAPPYPVWEHKSSPGEPLVLPHLFPGQWRHRSPPIPASRAALHARGLHCILFLLSRVIFVNQGPSCNRGKKF
jgi:hypothetical protein